MRTPEAGAVGAKPTIAYILKGWPRRSELFIASEIYRLEQLGFTIQLFVIKRPDETDTHAVVGRIAAVPTYLPHTSSVSGAWLPLWLARNLGPFLGPLARLLVRRPRGTVRGAGAAFLQAVRARRGTWAWPRKVYVKEFLQASALADALLRTGDIPHLHAHFCHGATTVAWLASLITGIPFSFTAHAKDLHVPDLNPAGLLPRKLRAARFAVTCTDANREFLASLVPGATVHCVYHGLNTDFTQLLEDTVLPERRNGVMRLLGVGRLVPKKGFDTLVEATHVLRTRDLPVRLVLVGEDGEHGPALRERIAALGLQDHVQLLAPMNQAALLTQYADANAFVMPCRVLENGDRDGIPNVLVEAMATALPVVTTPVCGIPELVQHQANGLLVPADDPEALAAAIERLYREPAFAEQMGAAAAHTVTTQFDGQRLAQSLATIFREALA